MQEASAFKAIGRRKESIARVRLTAGSGGFIVNKKPLDKYFTKETERLVVKQPLQLTNTLDKFNIVANLTGGGFCGQAGALRLGISRALVMVDASFRDTLKQNGFLTRDPRMKERKKYGQKGARKRFQWTKR
ncbi:MAG: 30S ribosomal protein S9 [Candidatus Omnitrophica bacterium]|nr:30S ribosomal protein S9 [Candidatus Omnitrophota bacterium]MDD5610480.1 30S ribosomal protein S9 [Candidatus Omnitrophota bacterium]